VRDSIPISISFFVSRARLELELNLKCQGQIIIDMDRLVRLFADEPLTDEDLRPWLIAVEPAPKEGVVSDLESAARPRYIGDAEYHQMMATLDEKSTQVRDKILQNYGDEMETFAAKLFDAKRMIGVQAIMMKAITDCDVPVALYQLLAELRSIEKIISLTRVARGGCGGFSYSELNYD